MIPDAPVSCGATHENDPAAMHPDADELLEELARLDATMAHVVASAGDGGNPDLERVLDEVVSHIGDVYDQRQLVDLGRYLTPFHLLPSRWRRKAFFSGESSSRAVIIRWISPVPS